MDKPDSGRSKVDIVGLLAATTGIFSVLEEADLRRLESELEWVGVPGGEILIQQGDPGDSMYVVVSGRLRVSRRNDEGTEQVLGEIGRGESVGEMALLTGEHRFATVRAIRDSGLVRFSQDAFERIVSKNPGAAMLIARRLVMRLEQQGKANVGHGLSTVGVVATGNDVPLADFCTRLTAALAQWGPTLHLNSAMLESHFGPGTATAQDDATTLRIDAWLDELEAKYKYLIYEADPGPSPWTDCCARQADRLLFVARSTATPPAKVAASLSLEHTTARREMVLLHVDGNRSPSETRRWYEPFRAATHHHVGMNTPSDYDRLARIMTGHAVGLTLGGGGARGLAHLGVIRAMQEARIPIDMICGTSMGAVIAGQYAMGHDFQTLLEINRKGWIGMDPLKDKTLPLVALLAGKKLDRMLTMMFGDARIEDLWIKYFCVSANLTHAKAIVHDSGLLKRAVRASMAIPGVAAPLCDNGDLIVDGGVLNNLPGDVMRTICGGTVFAVDVSPQKDLAVDPAYRELPSAWRILWSRVNPLAKPLNVPNIFAVMMRTLMLSSVHKSDLVMKDVDLYIRPPVDSYGIFEWHSIDQIVDAGYQYARKKLEEWQAGHSAAPHGVAAAPPPVRVSSRRDKWQKHANSAGIFEPRAKVLRQIRNCRVDALPDGRGARCRSRVHQRPQAL